MQLLADYFPLLLFFLAFKWQGIYVATAVAIVASVAQIAWFNWKGKLSAIHWMSFAIIAVFGGATLSCRTRCSSSGSRRCSTACSAPSSPSASSPSGAT